MPRFANAVSLLIRSFGIGLLGSWCPGDDALPRVEANAPEKTLSTFQIESGFALELLASEPLVTDPVAMVYDERGRAFVAEMCDYPFVERTHDKPFSENSQDLPLGRIRLLEDLNGDGIFDKSTLFADALSWPLSHVLDPNREVAPNFISYSIAMEDGRTISGIVVEDSATVIKFRTTTGALESVDSNRIDQMSSSGLSLMPEGLPERITPEEMSDLITYIMSGTSR